MRIKSLFMVGVIASVVVGMAAALGLWSVYQDYRDAVVRERSATSIVTAIFQLTSITGNYTLYRQNRARDQWIVRHKSLGNLMQELALQGAEAVQEFNFLKRNHAAAQRIFERLVGSFAQDRENGIGIEVTSDFEKRLIDTLLGMTQAMVSEASLLSLQSRTALDVSNARISWLVVCLILAFAMTLMGLWLLLARRVVLPLQTLTRDIDAFGSGALGHRLHARRADEIGEVATAFNAMAGRLAETVVSRDELAKEIIERRLVEEALRENEGTLRAITDHSPSIIYLRDRNARILKINKAYEDFYGISQAEALGKIGAEWLGEALAERLIGEDREVLSTGIPLATEFEINNSAGEPRYKQSIKFPVLNEDGVVVAVGGITTDVTEHRQREEQLQQAQKMEAVGQLTGGIAHEFNNLLMVISGNLEFLDDRLANDEQLRHFVSTALTSVMRGAELTKNLLSFSRKQSLRNVSVAMNELVLPMRDMLRRTLGETIEIETDFSENLWLTLADAGQIKNAVVNLTINARHAMPNGGKIVLRTSNRTVVGNDLRATDPDVIPGDYVMLEVIDTGSGMPLEVIQHAFEPFYTTKGVGEGTGLGLSMVHGFAKQSGGFAEIDSEVGRGTTVRLCLPRAEGQDGDDAEEDREPQKSSEGNGTILVVEDDPDLLALMVSLITEFGYDTIEAEDGKAALARLEERPDIDLLFTDVVLPHGQSGVDVARIACRRWPDLKVVYTSGYPEKNLGDLTVEGKAPPVIRKPYRKSKLAETLAAILQT